MSSEQGAREAAWTAFLQEYRDRWREPSMTPFSASRQAWEFAREAHSAAWAACAARVREQVLSEVESAISAWEIDDRGMSLAAVIQEAIAAVRAAEEAAMAGEVDLEAVRERCTAYQNDLMPWRQLGSDLASEIIWQDVPALLALTESQSRRIAALEAQIADMEEEWKHAAWERSERD
jgi:hypothetical protein